MNFSNIEMCNYNNNNNNVVVLANYNLNLIVNDVLNHTLYFQKF